MEKNYDAFLDVSSDSINEKYTNKVYVDDANKYAISTNGYMILARRDMYEQVKCTLKLLGTAVGSINKETRALEACDNPTLNALSSFCNASSVTKTNTRKFRIKFPTFLSSVSKKKRHAVFYLSFFEPLALFSPLLLVVSSVLQHLCPRAVSAAVAGAYSSREFALGVFYSVL